MKKNLKYIIILTGFILLFILIQFITPQGVDWSPGFSRTEKKPYGTYLLYDMSSILFPRRKIIVSEKSVYDRLNDKKIFNTNYIFINNTLDFDEFDTRELLKYISKGNNVFMAARHITGSLAEKFSIDISSEDSWSETNNINFKNRRLKKRNGFLFKKRTGLGYFSDFVKKGATVLSVNKNGNVTYIKIRHGRGNLYLSSLPFAYTNYNILSEDNWKYVFKSLSYLPVRTTYWDEYYKPYRIAIRTPLRYILSNEALSWAYYLSIITLLIFVIFHARRRQRIIPIIKPLKNSTLDFIYMVGQTYFQQKDNKNISQKMVLYFLEHIRSYYNYESSHFSADMYKQLSIKSGVALDDVVSLFNLISIVESSNKISDGDLIGLNAAFDNFYKVSGYRGEKLKNLNL